MGVDVFAAVMQQVAAQFPDPPVDHEFVVGINAAPSGASPAPESDLSVRIPIPMSNPSLAVPVQAGGTKGVARCSLGILGEEILNLIAQLRGNGFVGVQSKDPVAGGPGRGGIFLSDVAFPGFAENFGAEVQGNFLGTIADIFVQHDNHFAGPFVYTFKSTADAAGFGSGNHANGDGQLVHGAEPKVGVACASTSNAGSGGQGKPQTGGKFCRKEHREHKD